MVKFPDIEDLLESLDRAELGKPKEFADAALRLLAHPCAEHTVDVTDLLVTVLALSTEVPSSASWLKRVFTRLLERPQPQGEIFAACLEALGETALGSQVFVERMEAWTGRPLDGLGIKNDSPGSPDIWLIDVLASFDGIAARRYFDRCVSVLEVGPDPVGHLPEFIKLGVSKEWLTEGDERHGSLHALAATRDPVADFDAEVSAKRLARMSSSHPAAAGSAPCPVCGRTSVI